MVQVHLEEIKLGDIVYVLDDSDDEITESKVVGIHQRLNHHDETEWRVEVNLAEKRYSGGDTHEIDPEHTFTTLKGAENALKRRIADEVADKHKRIRIVKISEKGTR